MQQSPEEDLWCQRIEAHGDWSVSWAAADSQWVKAQSLVRCFSFCTGRILRTGLLSMASLHAYADDTQLYLHFNRTEIASSVDQLERCFIDISDTGLDVRTDWSSTPIKQNACSLPARVTAAPRLVAGIRHSNSSTRSGHCRCLQPCSSARRRHLFWSQSGSPRLSHLASAWAAITDCVNSDVSGGG